MSPNYSQLIFFRNMFNIFLSHILEFRYMWIRLIPFFALDAKTLVLKMVNSPPSPPTAFSPQFAAASAVPPARMSLSWCLNSEGTNNIEKYPLYRQSPAAVFRWRSLVAMDIFLDGELNTHRDDWPLTYFGVLTWPWTPATQGKTGNIYSCTRNPNKFTKKKKVTFAVRPEKKRR